MRLYSGRVFRDPIESILDKRVPVRHPCYNFRHPCYNFRHMLQWNSTQVGTSDRLKVYRTPCKQFQHDRRVIFHFHNPLSTSHFVPVSWNKLFMYLFYRLYWELELSWASEWYFGPDTDIKQPLIELCKNALWVSIWSNIFPAEEIIIALPRKYQLGLMAESLLKGSVLNIVLDPF